MEAYIDSRMDQCQRNNIEAPLEQLGSLRIIEEDTSNKTKITKTETMKCQQHQY